MSSDTIFFGSHFLVLMTKKEKLIGERLNKVHEHFSDFLNPSKKERPQTRNIELEIIYTEPKQNAYKQISEISTQVVVEIQSLSTLHFTLWPKKKGYTQTNPIAQTASILSLFHPSPRPNSTENSLIFDGKISSIFWWVACTECMVALKEFVYAVGEFDFCFLISF